MALDKLVDSTQLDADLTSVANAIRTKGGTSGSLAFPAGFVSAIGDIPSGDTVYYGEEGCPYVKDVVIPSSKASVSFYGCKYLETIYAPNATSIGGNPGGYKCERLKSVHFPKLTSITSGYFIRQQGVSTHSLESVTVGSIGYPVTSLAAAYKRWFYGDCKDGCTVTIFVNAQTIAEVPADVANYVIGDAHPSGYTINVVYKNSTTGEVLTA